MSKIAPEALSALKNNQRQLDADGCEVGVSRQALDEAVAFIEAALSAADGEPAELPEMIQTAKDAYHLMREWSGSAFLNGEVDPGMTDAECKSHLYRDLCVLGNHMLWLEDKLTALTAPPAVDVKPLEWTICTSPKDALVSITVAGDYVIRSVAASGYVRLALPGQSGWTRYSDTDAAKSAAQADYEARIRSALLSPADTSPEPVIPKGWQLVPKDPTDAMTKAALATDWECDGDEIGVVINVWHDMIAAAPKEASHD